MTKQKENKIKSIILKHLKNWILKKFFNLKLMNLNLNKEFRKYFNLNKNMKIFI